MAARAVIELKKRYSDLRLTMLIPYHPSIHPVELPAGFDGSCFPDGQEKVPHRAAILRANLYMVRRVSHLICYVVHPAGGSRGVMEKAIKQKIHVTNLGGQNC